MNIIAYRNFRNLAFLKRIVKEKEFYVEKLLTQFIIDYGINWQYIMLPPI